MILIYLQERGRQLEMEVIMLKMVLIKENLSMQFLTATILQFLESTALYNQIIPILDFSAMWKIR